MKRPFPDFQFIVAVALLGSSFNTYAQEITAINADQTKVRMGSSVNVQVNFNLRDIPNPYCGLEINFGDGETHKGRPGYNGPQDFPYNVSHIYRNAGTYVVKVAGIYVSRGLRSAIACTGDPKQVNIFVSDPLIDKATEDTDRKSQELAVKELELQRLSEKLESDRRALERKEKYQESQRRALETRDKMPSESLNISKPQGGSSTKPKVDPF
jgi:hypothetical protein